MNFMSFQKILRYSCNTLLFVGTEWVLISAEEYAWWQSYIPSTETVFETVPWHIDSPVDPVMCDESVVWGDSAARRGNEGSEGHEGLVCELLWHDTRLHSATGQYITYHIIIMLSREVNKFINFHWLKNILVSWVYMYEGIFYLFGYFFGKLE